MWTLISSIQTQSCTKLENYTLQEELDQKRPGIQFVTTTSSIEGYKIEKYLGIVTYQAVHCTDIFSDIMAGFSDVFGGYSATYQKKLKEIENNVISELKKKAQQLGANAIIGIQLDFDEISRKGKGMLMLTAQGTAVKIDISDISAPHTEGNIITYEELDNAILKKKIMEDLRKGEFKIREIDDLQVLINHEIGAFYEVMDFILNEPVDIKAKSELLKLFMLNVNKLQISEYLKKDHIIELDTNTFKRVISVVGLVDWFDFDLIDYLLKQENPKAHQKALILLGFQKPDYSLEDIPLMEKLVTQIQKTFVAYPLITNKTGMFGKQKEVWKCINCGKENDLDTQICSEYNCSAGIYGIRNNKITPHKLVKDWKLKIEVVKSLLG